MKPQFENLADFLNMGGYANYVFGAFLISIASMIGLWLLAILNEKKAQKRLKALEAMQNEKK